ncbi:hypothetical protein FQZ97_1212200 [compost metagenome]
MEVAQKLGEQWGAYFKRISREEFDHPAAGARRESAQIGSLPELRESNRTIPDGQCATGLSSVQDFRN